jgi:hypothetical protein
MGYPEQRESISLGLPVIERAIVSQKSESISMI